MSMEELKNLSEEEIAYGVAQFLDTVDATNDDFANSVEEYPGLSMLPTILREGLVSRGFTDEMAIACGKGAVMAIVSLVESIEIKNFKEIIPEFNAGEEGK